MIAEFGQLSLILAFCLAVVLSIIPMAGSYTGRRDWQLLARPLAAGQLLFLLLAFLLLLQCFVNDDFSVAYVAAHSNSQTPLIYKISALWGGHEGSMLLWVFILAIWTAAVACFSTSLPDLFVARVLAILGMISSGFQLFILFTSNPFARLLPYAPGEGQDLNPLLQDFGLIVHPPTLYMGYVGFAVAFAFACASLLGGRLDAAWARWSRPWTQVAWIFLTLGIALGSWWAYYELGWGGWWFWDPVENASLMPWLSGTALLHSLAVAEKRELFKSWTVFLALLTFSLSLLGTFLVRSGVLTSVHTFASDPTRGVFILFFLAVVVGMALLLFALRSPSLRDNKGFSALALETFLLGNNVLLVCACAVVLLGTLYPLVIDALGLGQISVGPPFFNTFIVPLATLLALILGFGVVARWKKGGLAQVRKALFMAAGAATATALLVSFFVEPTFTLHATCVLAVVLWMLFASLVSIVHRCRHKPSLWGGMRAIPASVWGMHLAHLGLAVTITGALMTSLYSSERSVALHSGESVEIGDYRFRFDGTKQLNGPNYSSDYGTVRVYQKGREVSVLHPEKRRFNAQGMVMTETAIKPGLIRDLYVVLGENLNNKTWSLRIEIKVFVRWLWLGALLMALGAALGLSDRRYRLAIGHQHRTYDNKAPERSVQI